MNPIFKILPVLTIVAGTGHAQLAVSADYDFADNSVPVAFTTSFGGGPATGGGVLTFDGTTAIQASTTTLYGT
ncbi:MAG: hypothetical protein K9N23_22135, partial [Akkermansiaceae bacterium]|nr:hypothetical protein [Akkermansiaceae bacterium]